MRKLYFSGEDSELCFDIEHFKDYMRYNNLKELKLFEAKRVTGTGYFFCKEHFEVGEVGENCGINNCHTYKPLNGKNGRCKHYGWCYEYSDKVRILKI